MVVLTVSGVVLSSLITERFIDVAPGGTAFKAPDVVMMLALLGEKVNVGPFVVLELEAALAADHE
jgi:hypothetical protein